MPAESFFYKETMSNTNRWQETCRTHFALTCINRCRCPLQVPWCMKTSGITEAVLWYIKGSDTEMPPLSKMRFTESNQFMAHHNPLIVSPPSLHYYLLSKVSKCHFPLPAKASRSLEPIRTQDQIMYFHHCSALRSELCWWFYSDWCDSPGPSGY